MEGAVALFRKYGIRSVSMDDICREMGISKKTMYQYVSNKADLVQKVLESQSAMVFDMIDGMKTSELNAIDTLLEVSQKLGALHKDSNPVIQYDLEKYYPDIHKKHREVRDKIIFTNLRENIRQGIKEGLYREDLNPDLLADLYIRKMEGINDADCYPSGKFSYHRMFNAMIENHIRGISNEKGLTYFENQKHKINF